MADEELEEDCMDNTNVTGCTHESKREHLLDVTGIETPLPEKHHSLVCFFFFKDSKLSIITNF